MIREQKLEEALERVRVYVEDAVETDGGINECDIEYRADLEAIDAALSAPKAEAVTVKPLEWKHYRNGDADAVTPFGGVYTAYASGYWRITERGKAGKPIRAGSDGASARAAVQADYEARIRSVIDTPLVPAITDVEKRIAEIIEEESTGGACCGWSPCSGCHETSEGAETGFYPFSRTFQCHVGGGCHECGGLGVVWRHYSERDLRLMEAEPASALTDEAVYSDDAMLRLAKDAVIKGVSRSSFSQCAEWAHDEACDDDAFPSNGGE